MGDRIINIAGDAVAVAAILSVQAIVSLGYLQSLIGS
jgi:hypothetical protein